MFYFFIIFIYYYLFYEHLLEIIFYYLFFYEIIFYLNLGHLIFRNYLFRFLVIIIVVRFGLFHLFFRCNCDGGDEIEFIFEVLIVFLFFLGLEPSLFTMRPEDLILF